jgi:hypothetical protein
MDQLLDMLTQQLGQQGVGKIGQQLGLNEAQSESAIGAALPVLMGALARNAQKPEGAAALAGALDRDHDGSLLNNLDGFLQNPAQANGAGILGHVLGSKRSRVEQYVSKSAGLSGQQSGQLLEMLAPLVLGSLGQQKRQQNLDSNGLSSLLGGLLNSGALGGGQAGAGRAQGGNPLLNALLDQDGDGDINDDLIGMGGKLLGGLFGRKR